MSQVLIISYETFRLHCERFKAAGVCDLLVCDEAHRLKNDATMTNKVGRTRLTMTKRASQPCPTMTSQMKRRTTMHHTASLCTARHHTSSHLTKPHHTSSHLTTPNLTKPHLTSSHLITPAHY